jgi:hypothetical protein
MDYRIELHEIGEFRMGALAFGATIFSGSTVISCLENIHVFSGSMESPDISELVDEDPEQNTIVLIGTFSSFVIDLNKAKLSLFKHTIRDSSGIWCEETPIYKDRQEHVSSKFGKHYYIQIPFYNQDQINEKVQAYEQLRLAQIKAMKKKWF